MELAATIKYLAALLFLAVICAAGVRIFLSDQSAIVGWSVYILLFLTIFIPVDIVRRKRLRGRDAN